MKKRVALFGLLCVLPVFAQGPTFDSSGNGMLNGTYYFRHIIYGIDASGQSTGIPGTINQAIALYGNISFDGAGHYTMVNAAASDSQNQVSSDPLACYLAGTTSQSSCANSTVAGTYSVSSSGFAFLSNPITSDRIYGLVSANHIFVGSSTEATQSYNDIFIAAAVPSPTPTNSFFSGTYTVAGYFPAGNPLSAEDAFFQFTPDGAGHLGTVSIGGYLGNGNTTSQSSSNVTYNFQSGAAIVSFPLNNNAAFFPGGTANPEYFYFSPDGNFFFGGSPTSGFDMIVGVRNTSGTQNFSGLYYQAGIDQDNSNLSAGYADFDGFFGSMNVTSGGIILEHQRVSSIQYGIYGDSFADSFTPPITGNYVDQTAALQHSFGGGGVVRISEDIPPYLGIHVALQAPSFTPPGSSVPYIYPTGIVNQASFAPFTAGVSNGEMVTLFGNNLSSKTVPNSGLPLPTSGGLNGVTVTVNGTPAPLFYVSPSQILINVPYEATLACAQVGNMSCYAQFQVTNAAGTSNAVTEVLNATTPGVFTGNSGLGYGYVQHSADYSLVTPSNPAQPGETVMAYVSGLGNVSPIVADGAASPGGENTVNTITADIGGIAAPVIFAGLVPTLTGLYQVNLTIPSNAVAGDNTIDISGPDSFANQALISIGSGTGAADRKAAPMSRHQMRSRSLTPRPLACFAAKCP